MSLPVAAVVAGGGATTRVDSTSWSAFTHFFNSTASAVDDAPAGGRAAGRMCRTQRVRPASYQTSEGGGRATLCSRCATIPRSICDCRRTGRPRRGAHPSGMDADEQKPRQRSLWRALRKNCYWKCFVLTLMIDACLAIIFWCQWSQRSYTSSGSFGATVDTRKNACEQGYNFIPVAFAVMLYVVYIMECWHCRTRLDLLCKADVQSVYDYVAQLKEALPVVWWRAVCYHYIRRTRQVTSLSASALFYLRYRNGDSVTTTQVYYERINSHTAGAVFLYQECGVKDISKKLVGLDKYPVTKVRFTKGFVFANLQAANEFEEQRARFFQENEQRDDYMEVREGLDLIHVPFKEHMVAFSDPNRRPWFIAQPTFWLCSLLLLSWPLRVFIEYRTACVNYQVTKLFGTNYLSPSSQNYTGPLTRVSTMDSGELAAVMENNYVVVPSYSEALLMDPAHNRSALITQNGGVHVHARPPPGASSRLASNGTPFALSKIGLGNFRRPRNANANEDECSREAILCNERVFANYGAFVREAARTDAAGSRRPGAGQPTAGRISDMSPLQQLLHSAQRRSKSLNLLLFRRSSSGGPTTASTPRSTSFGSLAAIVNSRRAYRTLPATPDAEAAAHCAFGAPEEPPPSYDSALKLCQPVTGYGAGRRCKLLSSNLVAPVAIVDDEEEEEASERTTTSHHDAAL